MLHEFRAGMDEAARMTRGGRLEEATALIQRLIGSGGGAPAEAPVASAGPALPAPEILRQTDPEPEIRRKPTRSRGSAATPRAGRERRPGLRETLRRLAERAGALEAEEIAPPVPSGARFAAAAHRSPAGARDYRVYLPAGADTAAAPLPVMVMMHGCTQNPDDFALGTRMNAAAEEAGVIVIYPAQPHSANPNRCWNWFRPEDQRRESGEPALVAGIVRDVVAAQNADPGRVYVAGLSAGGAAAAVLGAEYPELFAAVGVHSGLPHGAASDLGSALAAMRQGARGAAAERPVRTIVFHGDADRTVSVSNATALAAQATSAAGALELKVERGTAGGRDFSRALHRDAEGRTVCEQWTIHGAGHAWSGGDASGSHADPLGPDASREMLRFFLKG